ncbi:helix-turn-helix domain-containing protein [Nocardia implantans]|uniref:Helix-turn-helix domain-containing protein n=1 Tax=Nocardia implantans TaxID=3108168 RepID=A0ABU6AX44_9NOCA|nr:MULTISPECIES: helix-turn-helix domain-containing protein [unclassified Nocardia]MBF6193794.1 helix-turn-helix transcriptional regulator [Nocardia beijingensis]MEA3529471.1 helix-turn-helix domain-containing protein [Nocardia sp. CDC192]MEB3512057.1 helix-turn-helix domain-containing protein [Nocardia sp. CDC186]
MRRTSFEEMNCSLAQCLEVVGEWWTLLIVRDALFGVTRFDDFRARLGIARNVLTQRLEHLIEHGVLTREPYQDNPVRYDYRLTPKGRSLWLVVTAMRQWGDEWAAPDGPPVQTLHTTCGHLATVEPVCSVCGERIAVRDLRPVLGPGAKDPSLLPSS